MADQKTKVLHSVRIIAGIALILGGILIAFILIKHQYDDCAYRWINDLDGFRKKYASAWECFADRSMSLIALSLFGGAGLSALGCYLLRSA